MNATALKEETARLVMRPNLGELFAIPLDQVHESSLNPRRHYEPLALKELADSLQASGQLTPAIVRPRPNGDGYELAAGHRRYRAAKMAGFTELMAIVRIMDNKTFLEILTIENLQRDDLHPLEEAQGFTDLMKHAGYDVAKIAARIGKSTRYVYDLLKVHSELIPAAKKLFTENVFALGHAIILSRLTSEQQEAAIGDLEDVTDGGHPHASLLFRSQSGDTEELDLKDQIKPVSVREFQAAVERHVRAVPDRVDPVLFPESAKALEAAKEEKLAVIHITRDHRVSDDARDEKTRTYGSESWERADGLSEPDRYGDKPTKSKTCEFSRYGFVVAGDGQGEVFRVCVNKDKCKVHWREQAAAFERRKKAVKKDVKAGGGTTNREKEADREKQEEAKRAAERKAIEDRASRVKEALPALCSAVVDAVTHETVAQREHHVLAFLATSGSQWSGSGNISKKLIEEYVPKRGDFSLRAVLTLLLADINTYRLEHEMMEAFKACALGTKDFEAILDDVAPAKSADARKTEKKPKGKKAKK